jgi:galactoside O-acetyltransferase
MFRYIQLQGLTFKPVGINDDVWFGFNCVVLGGTIIGKGSIIAANAVIVEGVVENYSVMGGVPAKLIKKRK